MVDNVVEVKRELLDFTEKFIKRITLQVTAQLVKDTPVDTGWAQANWIPEIGVSFNDVVGSSEAVTSGPQSQGIAKVASVYRLPSLIFISNNVNYITRLNEGSSAKAPVGFVQLAIDKAIKDVG